VTVSIRVATSPGEARIAVVRDNRLLDYAIWRPGAPDGVGDVHVGRVIASVPAMAGAFVALADAEGFLPNSESAPGSAKGGLTAGTMLTVRVTRAAQGSKGPRLSARLERSTGDGGPVRLLRRGADPVARLAGRYPEAPIMVDNPGVAAELRADLGGRVSVAASVFDEDVAEAIDALSCPVVELASGARLSIWPTPALVAIDVDAAGGLARARHEALNREVLPALAEQIRLRNLSGGIVVDLAGMAARKRVALAPDFVRALADDPLRPKFLGFTALGLAEIVRARVHPPLHEVLSGPLAAGLAALRAVVGECGLNPRSGASAVRAHPAVVGALQDDPAAMTDLVRRTGRGVALRADPSLPALAWRLETENG
jgi:hypothetical protein